jgi:arginase family enzyme
MGHPLETDEIGLKGIADTIKQVVGNSLVYLSIDIDILGNNPNSAFPSHSASDFILTLS